ncbi:diaminopimelate decarboxylase [Buchnera aphidicola]|uniref:diaminopimelate decarboxylase n=1 Tax=Buchnera aphidicola TaxID=9 RepID=UPI002093A47D|nr:diaminopimelate decarboxylase [Buchnera aphidicola]USS94403.1 diaminopimelate decarboxylase [Buchnera aphidicola (Sipha maydis)]WII23564.1 diaminopimelate decarboxylase [Buchnera aphidicola (Sipha maydis)]
MNILKKIPVKKKKLLSLIKKYKTPLWLYHAKTIKKQIFKLKKFNIIRFAQKACSNIHILKLMKKYGTKVDAVSLGEIERAIKAGFKKNSNDIIYTSDIIDNETLRKVIEYNIPINIGSIDMIKKIGKKSKNHKIWIRINPGFGHGHNKKTNTGGKNSKHGIWNTKLALDLIKKYKLNLIGLHMHIGSGVDYRHLKKVCNAMIQEAEKINCKLSYISAGGGLTIPYKTSDKEININNYYEIWENARKRISKKLNCKMKLEIEPGRFLVAESGFLISKIESIKEVDKRKFILVNVGFNELIRPTLYGSYHYISILPKDNRKINYLDTFEAIIGGPLCESGDIFTQKKDNSIYTIKIPKVKYGDYIIFHDVGAYGSSMSSNYNSRPLIPEILIKNKKIIQIRRRQTIEEMLSLEI